jgi:hypothetical protein
MVGPHNDFFSPLPRTVFVKESGVRPFDRIAQSCHPLTQKSVQQDDLPKLHNAFML